METVDAPSLGKLAQRVGLLEEAALNEALEETGPRNADPAPLVRYLERKGLLTPWQTAKLLKGDTDGYFLGGYRLLYKISSGSFGRVFRADDPRSGRVVAIKVLRRRWSEDPQRIALFFREGKVGTTLRHPNIVEMLATGHDAVTGQYYLVMEFVEGGNLREILQIRGRLAPLEAVRILDDCLAGLAYAHSRGLTHRDVKLTNILVSGAGAAKLVDFGLAQHFAVTDRDDQEKVERTVEYAGLERATNVKPGDVRSDLFFLGCTFYETLTGRAPLNPTRDRHARQRTQRFAEVEPIRPQEVAAPPSLFALVETMMSLDPARRYQTPSQALDAVRAVRRELENKSAGGAAGPKTLFIVESDERLQDALRNRFKELGYRVLMAADPTRALDRFRQQPFDALIVDAGSVGQDGRLVFQHILEEAARRNYPCGGVLILSEDQAGWAQEIPRRARSAVLVRPVTMKKLEQALAAVWGKNLNHRAPRTPGVNEPTPPLKPRIPRPDG